jgi:hypothetical protein
MRRLAGVLVSLMSGYAFAQGGYPGGHGEASRDRREIRQDRAEARDDYWDLARIEALVSRFDGARASRDRAALASIDQDVRIVLATEKRESHREMAADRAEVHRSAHEVRSEGREVRRDMATGRPVHGDMRDMRDDRRDLRDDWRDLQLEKATLRKLQSMSEEWSRLEGRMDRRGLDRKRLLLGDLVVMARRELSQNRKEMQEDRREMREDRRERREDGYRR